MKILILISLFALISISQCASVSMKAELKEIHVYLGDALASVLNSTKVEFNDLLSFVDKHRFLHNILKNFAKDKKNAMTECPGSFADGLLYTGSEELHRKENEAAEAYINNKSFRSNYSLYALAFPESKCLSYVYNYVLLNTSKSISSEKFDPVRIYYGLLQIIDAMIGETQLRKDRLEVLESNSAWN